MRLLTLRTVIAGTDLTPASDPALETAGRLAAAAGAALHIVHVVPSADQAADETQRTPLRQDIEAAIQRVGVATQKHMVHILSGGAPAVISSLADRVGADLIILGRHRDAPDRHGALGSTAYELITRSRVPCLVVTRTRALLMNCVLAATDSSESARGALLVALSWASALRSRASHAREPVVLALHVDCNGSAGGQASHDSLQHELDLLRRTAGDWAGVCVRGTTYASDDPVVGIVEYARQHEVDLVVLGTRGVAVSDESGLGSVSAAVTRELDVPVLLVPPAVWHEVARDLESP